MKGQKGITLIALIVTIIVMLILAITAFAMLFDEDTGIISRATRAGKRTEEAQIIDYMNNVLVSIAMDSTERRALGEEPRTKRESVYEEYHAEMITEYYNNAQRRLLKIGDKRNEIYIVTSGDEDTLAIVVSDMDSNVYLGAVDMYNGTKMSAEKVDYKLGDLVDYGNTYLGIGSISDDLWGILNEKLK